MPIILNQDQYFVNPLLSKMDGGTATFTATFTGTAAVILPVFTCPANEIYRIKKIISSIYVISTSTTITQAVATLTIGASSHIIDGMDGTALSKFGEAVYSQHWIQPGDIISLRGDSTAGGTHTLTIACSVILDAYFI
jgi:hypothetical protein